MYGDSGFATTETIHHTVHSSKRRCPRPPDRILIATDTLALRNPTPQESNLPCLRGIDRRGCQSDASHTTAKRTSSHRPTRQNLTAIYGTRLEIIVVIVNLSLCRRSCWYHSAPAYSLLILHDRRDIRLFKTPFITQPLSLPNLYVPTSKRPHTHPARLCQNPPTHPWWPVLTLLYFAFAQTRPDTTPYSDSIPRPRFQFIHASPSSHHSCQTSHHSAALSSIAVLQSPASPAKPSSLVAFYLDTAQLSLVARGAVVKGTRPHPLTLFAPPTPGKFNIVSCP